MSQNPSASRFKIESNEMKQFTSPEGGYLYMIQINCSNLKGTERVTCSTLLSISAVTIQELKGDTSDTTVNVVDAFS